MEDGGGDGVEAAPRAVRTNMRIYVHIARIYECIHTYECINIYIARIYTCTRIYLVEDDGGDGVEGAPRALRDHA